MRYFFILAALLPLAACTPEPIKLKNGYTAGNYKVVAVDVTEDYSKPLLPDKLKPEEFQVVRSKLIESLTAKLQNVGQGPNIGITVEINSAKIYTAKPKIFAMLIVWDANSKQELGQYLVAYQEITPAGGGGGGLIGALGAAIGTGLADSTVGNEGEARSIAGLTENIVEKLYPPKKQ